MNVRVMGLCGHFHLVLEDGPFVNAVARGLVAAAAFVGVAVALPATTS